MTDLIPITPEQFSLSDCVAVHLVVPPRPRVGVCATCRTWTEPGLTLCANCIEVQQYLGTEPIPLDVVTLYTKPSMMREILTRYKGRPTDEADGDPPSRECVTIVETMLVRFFHEHFQALLKFAGPVDAVVVVPSTLSQPPHPLQSILAVCKLPVPVEPLLVRGPGSLGFRQPAFDGYVCVGQDSPRRVYLIDDVYTTGARLNSAAYALSRAGHTIVGSLVLARRINPDYHPQAQDLWSAQCGVPYSWVTSPLLSSRTDATDD